MFDWISIDLYGIPETVALGTVALMGYLFGTRSRHPEPEGVTEKARRELKRATSIAQELEKIASSIRKDLASHCESVTKFKSKIAALTKEEKEQSWKSLCSEAEKILSPTLKLATQISHAYDQIRLQSSQLMSFTEIRTDPLTGVCNRRALEEQVEIALSMMSRYKHPFSICIVDIDHFKQLNDREGHLSGDRALQKVASLIDNAARETDVVARYGGEEFVIVMPQTGLMGASVFADRLRQIIADDMEVTISCGVSEAVKGDTQQTLLSKADSALYSAKANGRNCLYLHTGTKIRAFKTLSKDPEKEPVQQFPLLEQLPPQPLVDASDASTV